MSENKVTHQSQQVSLKAVLKEVVSMVASDIEARSIELQTNIEADVPDRISCDVGKLK